MQHFFSYRKGKNIKGRSSRKINDSVSSYITLQDKIARCFVSKKSMRKKTYKLIRYRSDELYVVFLPFINSRPSARYTKNIIKSTPSKRRRAGKILIKRSRTRLGKMNK